MSTTAIRGFFLAPFRGATYKRALYLVLAFPLGIAYFVALVAGTSIGLSLVVIWVGIPILVATLLAWRTAAGIDLSVR